MQNILLLYSYHIHVQTGFYSLPIQCIFSWRIEKSSYKTRRFQVFFLARMMSVLAHNKLNSFLIYL